jgi:hypothetical protein
MAEKLCRRNRNLPAIEAKYIGSRSVSGTVVMVQTERGRELLRPRFDLIRHHPVGFDWAHSGSGPGQLALALLAHASGDDEFALEHYQIFQHEIIARLPKAGWELTSQQALQMLRFVSQGTQMELISLRPATAKTRKTAVIHALVPSKTHNSQITAHGSARCIGEAVTRAIRNLLRDTRLRRTTIVNLQMELSVFNTEPEVEQRIADGDAYLRE